MIRIPKFIVFTFIFFNSFNSTWAEEKKVENVQTNVQITIKNLKKESDLKNATLYIAAIPEGQSLFSDHSVEDSASQKDFDWQAHNEKLPFLFKVGNLSASISEKVSLPAKTFRITAMIKKSGASCEIIDNKGVSSCFPEKEDILCSEHSARLDYAQQRQISIQCHLPSEGKI